MESVKALKAVLCALPIVALATICARVPSPFPPQEPTLDLLKELNVKNLYLSVH
jgi:hypothetical protein